MRRVLLPLLLLASCGTPGAEVRPQEGDFAFLEFKLGS